MAARTGQAVLAACSLPIDAPADPPDWFARAGSRDGYRAYWERPELGTRAPRLGRRAIGPLRQPHPPC
ncbi:MAG: hypothetical protein U0841_28310 [Chloroflexia bacterium]